MSLPCPPGLITGARIWELESANTTHKAKPEAMQLYSGLHLLLFSTLFLLSHISPPSRLALCRTAVGVGCAHLGAGARQHHAEGQARGLPVPALAFGSGPACRSGG